MIAALTCALAGLVLAKAIRPSGWRWGAAAGAGLGLAVLLVWRIWNRPVPAMLELSTPEDFWPLALLLAGVGPPLISRLVASEIGDRKPPGRGWPLLALLLVLAYFGVRWELRGRAEGNLRDRVYEGEPPLRVLALPSAVNPLDWTGLVETRSAFRVVPVHLLEEFDPESGRTLYRSAARGSIERARSGVEWKRWGCWFEWPHWTAIPAGDREEVTVEDLRLGWRIEFRIDRASGQIVEERTLR